MGMADKMKEKALSGTSVVRSSKVVKTVSYTHLILSKITIDHIIL